MGEIVIRGSLSHLYMRASRIINVEKDREAMGYRILQHDEDWMFITQRDKDVCDEICRPKEHTMHRGDYIPNRFPYHTWIDQRHIKARAHMPRDDYCRCILSWMDSEETIRERLHMEITLVI